LPVLLMLAACAGCLAGCASSGPRSVTSELQPFTPTEQQAWDNARNAEYKLRIGDVFDVYFEYYSDLDQSEVIVLPDGRISLPYIDSVSAVGLTISELDSAITANYAVDYLDPAMSIVIREFGEIMVYVLGEVNRPGLVILSPQNSNVLHAVSSAGGFTNNASTGDVLRMRVTPDGYLYSHLDLSHLEKREFMSLALTDIQHYDIIYVPRSTIGDIEVFNNRVLGTVLSVTSLFWDIYAIANIDKVDRLVR